MKKFLSFWLLLLAFCMPVAMNAQDTQIEIVVGDSTSSNSYLPSYSFYNYSLTQQIYEAEEIGMPGTIQSIAFFNTGTSQTRSYTVYMVETDKGQFNGSNDWITVSASDAVFTGSVTMTPGTWTVLQLNTPFVYDGASNLAIIVDDNTGTYSSGMTCVVGNAPSMAIRIYSDGTNYDPYNPGSYSGTVMDVKNRIKIGIVPSGAITCFRPSSLTVESVDQTSATVSWVPYTGSTAWEVFCGTEDDDPDYATWVSSSDTFYTFNNLDPNVVYKAYVRTVCPGEVSSSRAVSFRTPQAPASIPYSCNFTDANENSQWLMTNTGTNHFVIGEGTSYDGGSDMSMYISNDSIGTYAADAVSSYSYAERIIDFGETPADYILSLDMKASGNLQGTSIYSALIVYLRDADEATPSGSLPSFVNNYLQYSVLEQDWTHKDIQLDSVSGMKKLLFLTWGYTNSGATQVPAAIDNISITETSCLTPDFTVVPDAYTASVSWDGTGSYVVIYRPKGTSADNNIYVDVVGDNTVLTNLTPATTYYIWVAQICNGDTSVLGFAHSFTTECATIEVTDDNAYVEDFNGITTGIPACWDNTEGTTTTDSYKWNYYATGESGSCVRFNSYSNSSGNTNMLKTPILDLTQVTDPQVSFSYKNASGGDFSVFLSTDSGVTYTTALATGLTNASAWASVSYPLSNLTDATSVVIVFKATSNYGSGDAYIYLDNVVVGATPSCPAPTNLTATSTATDTVILSWNDPNGDLWDIIYGPTGFDLNNSDDATTISGVMDNPYAVGELTAGVMYDFYIRRDCGGGDVSPWSLIPASAAPYTITMGITGSATVTGCSMTITDDGGPNGDYSNSCNYTLTILPGDPDSIVSISGVFAGEGSLDYLSIYDGTTATEDNLIVKLYSSMNGGSSGTQITFGPLVSESGPLTLLFHSDGSVVYPGFVATTACLPAPTCVKPTNLAATTITTDEATITWSANDNSSSYNVVISTQSNFNPDTCSEVLTTTTNSYDFTGLDNNTNYYVYVQADCGGDDVSMWSNILSFLTLAGEPAEVPYFTDFSDEDENSSWVLLNGTQTNQWYIGQPTEETDTVLFISNSGTSTSYSISSTSNVWAYRDLQFGDAAEFELDVKWKAQGESCCDYLKIFLGPIGAVEAGSTTAPSNVEALSGNLNVQNSYQHFTAALNSSYANTTKRLYFLWHNDGSVGTDPAAVIDEITITASNCGRPFDLAVQALGSSDADITFSPAMATDNGWDYALCVGNEQPDTAAISGQVADTVISFSNLDPATTYTLYVRTICDVEDYSSWSDPLTFTTACVFADLPIEENFDSYTSTGSASFPNCWSRSNTYSTSTNYPYISSSYSTSGNRSLYFYASTTTYNIAVLPSFDVTTYPINNLQISFMLRSTYLTNGIIVGVMSNPETPNSFVPVDTLYPSVTNQFDYLQTNLSNYTGDGQYVALKSINGSSAGMYLDDLVLEVIPTCPRPLNVTSVGATTSSITLSWQESGDATSWNIEYGPTGFTQGSGTTVVANTNPFTVDNLTATTSYDFYVQSVCSADDQSPWSFVCAANTTMEATDIPYATDFSDPNDAWILNNGACPNYWTRGTTNGINALYITTDGTSAGYNMSSSSVVSAQKLFNVGTAPTITVQFDIQVGGESSWDYFKLFLAPANVEYPASTASPSSSDYGYNSYSTYAYNFYDNGYGTQSSYPYIMNLASGTVHVIAIMDNPNTNPDANSTAQLVFAWKNDGSSGTQPGAIISNLMIGDISCPQPTGLTVDNIGMTTANVSWTAGGSETAWNLEYKEASATNWTVVPVTTNSYQLTGLTGNTAYTVRVQANCSADDQSIYTTTSFTTAACEVADQCTYTFVLEDDYGDGWNDGYLTLEQNGTVIQTLELTGGSIATETVNLCDNTSISLVWHEGEYDDEVSITLYDPNDSVIFSIIDLEYISSPTLFTFTTDCSGAGPVITNPTVATNAATAIAQTSATLNGTITNPDNVTITAKGFEWKATAGGTYTPVTVTGNNLTYNLTGLTANTGYTYKAFITYNGTTVYGQEVTFTSLPEDVQPCDVPTGLTVGTVTHESIAISWDANANVSSWNIQYRPVGGTLNSATSTTNSYTITGLAPETTYQIQVQANCNDGQTSDWTAYVSGTTLTGVNNYLLNSISLYPNPANDVINVQCTMYNVQLVEVIDVYGKVINTINVIDTPAQINVSTLASGMYFVRVTTEEGVATKSFVKR